MQNRTGGRTYGFREIRFTPDLCSGGGGVAWYPRRKSERGDMCLFVTDQGGSDRGYLGVDQTHCPRAPHAGQMP
jgi:hypothetical protein